MEMNCIATTIALAYALGSIPFGLLLTRVAGLGDVRNIGSGSIGATNVMRTGRKALGIATLLLDASKGAVAVQFAGALYGGHLAVLAGLFAVIGHVFPVWLRFKGGKGVATALGALFALNWMLALALCALWLAVFLMTRISSIASLLSIGYSAIIAYLFQNDGVELLCLCFAALIIFTHRSNIKRLLAGSEHSFRKPM